MVLRQADIEQHAAYWIERMHGPAVDSETAARFDQWIGADPRHIESFSRLSALWNAGALSRALATCCARNDNNPSEAGAVFPRTRKDLRAALTALRRTSAGRPRVLARRVSRAPAATMTAAGIAAVVALIFCFPLLRGALVQEAVYSTRTGQERIVTLPDGSSVHLGGATRLFARITPWSRSVSMKQGMAFFDIAHERLRSFEVHANASQIRVLGTAFDVELLARNAQQVRVYRGLVQVEDGGNSWHLPRGSGLFLSGTLLQRRDGLEGDRPDWLDGWYDAHDTPLSSILERLNRISPQQVVLAQPGLGELRLSGRLRVSDPHELLDIICAAEGLRWQRNGSRIVLSR
ncbi:FecR domain-containing protein [Novosphingobium sp. RD2P27]|uniref:FecR domain-containing protein n=1 Tax=Novosphingobium kalidii TaxID=3230299 RepID=A0ABV2D278_9SPHN